MFGFRQIRRTEAHGTPQAGFNFIKPRLSVVIELHIRSRTTT